MVKGLSTQSKILAGVIPIGIVVTVFAFIFAPPEEFVEFGTGIEDNFALKFSPPPTLSVTGQESFLIKCEIRNTINVLDKNGVIRQVIFDDSPQFSPAIQLSFLISTTGEPEFGSAIVRTFISCEDSALHSQGFGAFLVGGKITTKLTGTNFDNVQKDLRSISKSITGITDLTNKRFFELAQVTVNEATLDSILKDDKDYTTLIRVLTTGDLTFKQCVTISQFCTSSDRASNWVHTVKSNDAFTAFGLIVEGAEFAPVTSVQELVITDTRLESLGNKIDISDSNRIDFKIRVKDYQAGFDSIPRVSITDSSGTVRQTQSAGILTQTEDAGAFHVRDMVFRIPSGEEGLWCFELLRDDSGVRNPSKKCVTIYTGDNVETETETGTDETTTADISSGEVRLRYEVTTTGKTIQNDITMAGGIPIMFTPAQLVGIEDPNPAILSVWLQPQVFFSEGVLDDLNIEAGSANIEYTGKINLPEDVVTITGLQLKPDPADFTKNQASIILPSTKISTDEIEQLIKEQSRLPSGTTPITLEIVASGTFRLKDASGATQLGTFDNAKFSFNLDYVPPNQTGGDQCAENDPPASCSDTNQCDGVIIANTCVSAGNLDETTCFDANGNEVTCEDSNTSEEETNDNINMETDTDTKCFDAVGKVISCDEPADCDPNTDVNRCGKGVFTGDTEDPKENGESDNGDSTICDAIIGSFANCAEAGSDLTDITPTFELDLGGQLMTIAIVVGAVIAIIIIIAIAVRFIKK